MNLQWPQPLASPAKNPTRHPRPTIRGASSDLQPRSSTLGRLWLAWALLAAILQSSLGASSYQPKFGDPLLEPWRWQTFPELSGLAMEGMAEDKQGTMWFLTYDGPWAYNGTEWIFHSSRETLQGNADAFCVDPDGSLEVASTEGISQFKNGNWNHVLSFPFGSLRKLRVGRDGTLWVAASWGLLHRDGTNWTVFTSQEKAGKLSAPLRDRQLRVELIPDQLLNKPSPGSKPRVRTNFDQLYVDRQGRIWLATTSGEIVCYEPPAAGRPASGGRGGTGGTWSLYNETDGLVCGKNASILQRQDGTIWVVYATGSGHVNFLAGDVWRSLLLADFNMPGDCGDLTETDDGVLWFSAFGAVFAHRDRDWQVYQRPAAPIPNVDNFIFQSSDGALWLGGRNSLIERLEYGGGRWLTLQDLNFGWESPSGTQWFLHRDGRVVVHTKNQWLSYGPEDGLIDTPVTLLGTRTGEIWVAGSHEHTAATARFDGQKWVRSIHAGFSWGMDWRAAYAASDGSLWFGAAVDSSDSEHQQAGLMQFHNGRWIHHHQPGHTTPGDSDSDPAVLLPATRAPERVGKYYWLGETGDGRIWGGRNYLVVSDGHKWEQATPWPGLHADVILAMHTTRQHELWFGTRQLGAVRFDGHDWRCFQGTNGLLANTVTSITQTPDDSIWVATDHDISRFDGRTWTTEVLPPALVPPDEFGALKSSPSGGLWVNQFNPAWVVRAWPNARTFDQSDDKFQTLCHRYQGPPPETRITGVPKTVAYPGDLSVFWNGTAVWQEAKDQRLEFAYRLDNQPWSGYSDFRGHSFFSLPSGRHHLEVRARDLDFNVDPTPAATDFVVLPPVWHQAWFLALMLALGGLTAAQSLRILWEQDRLRKAQAQLEHRVRQRTAQLESANREMESFSYSVSHDLRAPLRAIDGFSRILLEDYSERLDTEGRATLERVRAASQRMGALIDDLLKLSRVSRGDLNRTLVNLSKLALEAVSELRNAQPDREVKTIIAPDLVVEGDSQLLLILMENLFSNAWKFTGRQPAPLVELGVKREGEENIFFVRDNGAGFDMAYVDKLFGAFQRLHNAKEFPGNGIGLATVQRIMHRHEGRVWAESTVGQGAVFYFTFQRKGKKHER